MEEYRRYNVIGYDDMCGLDSQGDYRTLSEARQKVRRLLSGPEAWEAAHIYDYKTGSVVESFNRDPHGDFTEEEFHRLSTRLCEYEPYAEAFEAYTDAAEAYRQASEALIDWSLSLPGFPAREKAILNEHRHEYSTRKKLIELALAIDPATIPKQ